MRNLPPLNLMTVSWFSGGVSSAVATKLAIDKIDKIIYTHIDDQHPDTLRFIKDCEDWFGKPVEILQSHLKTVEEAINASSTTEKKVISIPNSFAPCTNYLKKKVRFAWEEEYERWYRTYIWGMDLGEKVRVQNAIDAMPAQVHWFPLVDAGVTKERAHKILKASGIKRPEMYEMGYNNNNCIGCVKGGMGYWNHIRVDFPAVFKARAEMERRIGKTIIKGEIYLDELDPSQGMKLKPIVDNCGLMCEIIGIE